MVIQLFVVPGGWPEHVFWLSLLLLIIARGPGSIPLDHLIWYGRVPAPVLTHREARASFGSKELPLTKSGLVRYLSTMPVCYRIERAIVIQRSVVPLHGETKAGAIMRKSNSKG